ncbi:hypothetical protein LINPERHAP2_LOCUS32063 [Linum perenne]
MQMIVSVLGGPWDSLFGGRNLSGFVVGAVATALSGILALTMLPSPPPDVPASKVSLVGFIKRFCHRASDNIHGYPDHPHAAIVAVDGRKAIGPQMR